jgi:hypothetical protein
MVPLLCNCSIKLGNVGCLSVCLSTHLGTLNTVMSATFQHLYIGNQTLFPELNPICLRGLNKVTRMNGRTIAYVIAKAREEEVD